MFRLFSTPPPTNQPLVLKLSVCRPDGVPVIESSRVLPVQWDPVVTAVDVGEDVRSNEIAEANAGGPSCLHLWCDDAGNQAARSVKSIPDVALQAAERAVAEYAEPPSTAELPVIADTDRAEPAVAADGCWCKRGRNPR